jgi:SAM-dependent methyltransferase
MMRVKRDFTKIYAKEIDPWQIGEADSDRYNDYFDLILKNLAGTQAILDIGCGFGAFLSRFKPHFTHLTGLEISTAAIEKGKSRFPFIEFLQGSADSLEGAIADDRRFDVIILSDVIYYLSEAGRRNALHWIAGHLTKNGIAFIAGWCPGGRYLEMDELQHLVEREFAVQFSTQMETQHAVFIARRKHFFAAITIDYETWHPLPEGWKIDWDKDVFEPTEHFFDVCGSQGVSITLMAEMGEYFWLKQFDPPVAAKMENQWRDAVQKGHDVQIHLHPNWLPETGARFENGKWYWDWSISKCSEYPGDLTKLIRRCKETLESLLQQINPSYRAICFRAGTYKVQPFDRLYDALAANGIQADSSVYAGGFSTERGYDFRLAYSDHQPYFAAHYDPQLKSTPSECGVIELPIFTYQRDKRWFLDNREALRFAERIATYLSKHFDRSQSSESHRHTKQLKKLALIAYALMGPLGLWRNRIVPRALAQMVASYPPERLVGNEYFVMIGHTKGEHDFDAIRRNLEELRTDKRISFVTLADMTEIASKELAKSVHTDAVDETRYQVKREYHAIMSEERNDLQSYYLQDKIPLDRSMILDLGCGAGYWSERIHRLRPWATITGVDAGEDFIRKARERYGSERVRFQVADFAALPFESGSFDCVYADNTLEHAFDVTKTLSETFRVLSKDGVLCAAIPSDALNPRRTCDNHTWKTWTADVHTRLTAAGFVDIVIEEADTYRQFGMPPYPPSLDKMMYITAWKRGERASGKLERALAITRWVHERLNPEKPSAGYDPLEILRTGYAFCLGYSTVLGKMLRQEGYDVRWLSMIAYDHPRGLGKEKRDSHEVVLVTMDGKEQILDAMANTHMPYSLEEVLRNPSLASQKKNPDGQYKQRLYHMYDTEIWYSRIAKYVIRRNIEQKGFFWKTNPWRNPRG